MCRICRLNAPSRSLRLAARRAALAAQASAEVEITVEEDAVRSTLTWPLCTSLNAICMPLASPLHTTAAHATARPAYPALPLCSLQTKPAALVLEQMEKMEKSVEATKRSFNTVRTGRANPAMLDRIEVGAGPPPPIPGVPLLLWVLAHCCCGGWWHTAAVGHAGHEGARPCAHDESPPAGRRAAVPYGAELKPSVRAVLRQALCWRAAPKSGPPRRSCEAPPQALSAQTTTAPPLACLGPALVPAV